MTNRDVVDQFFEALNARRFDELDKLVLPDVVYELPQSGERIRGRENARASLENYPGLPTGDVERVSGAADRWVLSPSWTPLRISGTGDIYTIEARTVYPNGDVWNSIHILQFRDGKVSRVTDYYAAPFPAPEWRSRWVEKMENG